VPCIFRSALPDAIYSEIYSQLESGGRSLCRDLASMSLAISVGQQDHIRGFATAPVTLVEYGDYECLYCGAAYPVLNALLEYFESDLRVVFRHMPLTKMHSHAEFAAEAAEAAAAQGKFWEMHGALYQHQSILARDCIFGLARQMQLDLGRFEDDLLSHRYRNHVRGDCMGGVRSGAAGTPTFFINGERYDGNLVFINGEHPDGEVDQESLKAAVQRELNSIPLLP
jgi:protein-disulfide isomerase